MTTLIFRRYHKRYRIENHEFLFPCLIAREYILSGTVMSLAVILFSATAANYIGKLPHKQTIDNQMIMVEIKSLSLQLKNEITALIYFIICSDCWQQDNRLNYLVRK
jgi:hypothetical protein